MAIDREKVLATAQKFVEKKKYDKAVVEYQKIIQEDPNDARTLLKMGDLQSKMGEFAERGRDVRARREVLRAPGLRAEGHRRLQADPRDHREARPPARGALRAHHAEARRALPAARPDERRARRARRGRHAAAAPAPGRRGHRGLPPDRRARSDQPAAPPPPRRGALAREGRRRRRHRVRARRRRCS